MIGCGWYTLYALCARRGIQVLGYMTSSRTARAGVEGLCAPGHAGTEQGGSDFYFYWSQDWEFCCPDTSGSCSSSMPGSPGAQHPCPTLSILAFSLICSISLSLFCCCCCVCHPYTLTYTPFTAASHRYWMRKYYRFGCRPLTRESTHSCALCFPGRLYFWLQTGWEWIVIHPPRTTALHSGCGKGLSRMHSHGEKTCGFRWTQIPLRCLFSVDEHSAWSSISYFHTGNFVTC